MGKRTSRWQPSWHAQKLMESTLRRCCDQRKSTWRSRLRSKGHIARLRIRNASFLAIKRASCPSRKMHKTPLFDGVSPRQSIAVVEEGYPSQALPLFSKGFLGELLGLQISIILEKYCAEKGRVASHLTNTQMRTRLSTGLGILGRQSASVFGRGVLFCRNARAFLHVWSNHHINQETQAIARPRAPEAQPPRRRLSRRNCH